MNIHATATATPLTRRLLCPRVRQLKGLTSRIRLINHRGYGHDPAASLIAMIYLCCGGIFITLPIEG